MQRVVCDSIEEIIAIFKREPLFLKSHLAMSIANNHTRFWCNHAYADLLGYTIEEMMSLTYLDLLAPNQRIVLFHQFSDSNGMKFENGKDITLINWFIKKDGEEIDLFINITPIYDKNNQPIAGWVVLINHTEEQKAKEDLDRFKNQYSHLLEALNLIGLSLDLNGVIQEINFSGAKLLGWERHELIGKNWFDICVPLQNRAQTKEFYESNSGNIEMTKGSIVNQVLCRDGSIKIISWKWAFTKDHSGATVNSVSVGEDVTEKVKLEEERDRLLQNIISVSRHESIAQLVGGVAHEFNNVLSIILGFNKLAIKSVGNDDEVKLTSYMLEVDKAGKRAAKLIEQLQAYSKKSNLEAKEIDFAKEAEEIVSLAKSFFPSTVKFELHKKEKVKKFACDLSLFHQSLMNLMINAQEAMQGKGAITIGIQNKSILNAICDSCHKPFSGTFIELSVRNTGSNISPAVKDKIFDPFFSTKPVGQGTGMGLSVVHGFVHSSKGHVVIDNSASDSVAINLYFPTTQSVEIEERNFKNQKVEHKKVLVVDDEETLLFLYGRILKNLGIESECFSSPELALKEFQKNPNDFSLIITDQTMPGMLGIELVGEIKKLNPKIHTMLISGYSDVVDNKSSNLIDEYYVKPVDVSVLIGKIKTLFSI